MRAEDKELEGPDLARDERTRDEAEREEEELPVIGGDELQDLELAHRSTLFDAIRLVLAGEQLTLSLLYLPQRETHALEALQAAVEGHDSVGEFVFAEDRRALLEQALSVLQQNVTHGDPAQLAELHGKFDDLTERVAELRERLVNLEDAQDDMVDDVRRYARAAGEDGEGEAGDASDAPGKPEDPAHEPAHDPALDGPERPAPPRPPSTLYGDPLPEAPRPPSALDGPERPAPPRPPSTLYGDPLPEGPGPAPEGEAEGEAAAAKKPWWSRPFG